MATFFVNEGESIQAAINASSAGDTIIVGAGTYNESININKDVTRDLARRRGIDHHQRPGDEPGFSFCGQITAADATFGDTNHGFTVNAGRKRPPQSCRRRLECPRSKAT